MKKFIFLSFLFCATTLFGQDVSESLAVDIATQYYERVKDDNVNETDSLPAGLYFLRLIVNGKVETVEKIIKIQ